MKLEHECWMVWAMGASDGKNYPIWRSLADTEEASKNGAYQVFGYAHALSRLEEGTLKCLQTTISAGSE
jgi:hypothetical protein